MDSQSYCVRILLLVNHKMQIKFHLNLTQDNVPCYNADNTTIELYKLKISFTQWTTSSPDLNLIEILWNTMKDFTAIKCREEGRIESWYGRKRQVSHAQQSEMTPKVCESIESEELSKLIKSVLKECQVVINTHGGIPAISDQYYHHNDSKFQLTQIYQTSVGTLIDLITMFDKPV